MSADVAPPLATGSIDALKRVRAAETEWDQKLTIAKQDAGDALARARAAADEAVRSARLAAEQARGAKVQAARSDADRDAIQILADGAKAADAAAAGEGKRPADRANEILAAVLAGFTSD
jgi:vacuolar-type H+-ATPase subunit H